MEPWLVAILSLMFPVIMIIVGLVMKNGIWPKKSNWHSGYRTKMSRKNQDTWEFAQKHLGRVLVATGAIIIWPAIGFLFLSTGQDETQYLALVILLGAQVAAIILLIVFTEVALRKEFDENGNRKQ